MNSRIVLLMLSATVVTAQQERKAIAVVKGYSEGEEITGNITFTQVRNTVTIIGKVTGLRKGFHAFHIHEKGDLSNGCASTGSHFNPDKKKHGSPIDIERHVGDLGNIQADENGIAIIHIVDEFISLVNQKRNIIGRGLVIHSDADDLGIGGQSDSLTTGHAGSRVACGVIGTLNEDSITFLRGSATLISSNQMNFIAFMLSYQIVLRYCWH